jgi:diaminopimelate epimerase
MRRDWSSLAKAMCDRRFGIGGDGLLLLSSSKEADFRMRIFNADGSEAEMCGNGVRCLARYIFEAGMISEKVTELSIETLAGIKKVELEKTRGKLTAIRVGMGLPEFRAEKIPVAITKQPGSKSLDINIMNYPVGVDTNRLPMSFVSMGNPHAVCFVEQSVLEFPLLKLGPLVERHEIFPSRANFEVARVLNPESIEVRVWERGCGETLACGTGACAVAVVSQLQGFTGQKVSVKLPGGTLIIEWDKEGEVFLTGPAEITFTGKWPE